MRDIEAVGFDLFNTLITVEYSALDEALKRLTATLGESGLAVDHQDFIRAHEEAALRFAEKARRDGRETHNRFWISAALRSLGLEIPPEDPRMAAAVEAYFSAFLESARLIPGTREMLQKLAARFRLGLLSNFTHPPAARQIIARVGLAPFFGVVLISGDLGYRKPHPLVFEKLVEELAVRPERIAYVGDDPDADVNGALKAGIRPVWTTYIQNHKVPAAPGMLALPGGNPASAVPRISTWKELLALLEAD